MYTYCQNNKRVYVCICIPEVSRVCICICVYIWIPEAQHPRGHPGAITYICDHIYRSWQRKTLVSIYMYVYVYPRYHARRGTLAPSATRWAEEIAWRQVKDGTQQPHIAHLIHIERTHMCVNICVTCRYTCVYSYIYMYVYICIYICTYKWGKSPDAKSKTKTQQQHIAHVIHLIHLIHVEYTHKSKHENVCVYMCVCVYIYIYVHMSWRDRPTPSQRPNNSSRALRI